MNIWIVSSGEPLPIDEGSPRLRRMGMLSSILCNRGHEVHWFSSSFHHYKKKHRCEVDKEIRVKDNFIIHLIKTKGYKNNISFERLLHQRELARKFWINAKNLKKPDVIIATLAPLQLSKSVIKYAEINKIPTVIDIRDLWPEIYTEVIPRWGRGIIKPYVWFCKHQLKPVLRKSAAIIGVTPNFLKYGLEIAKLEKREFDKVFYTSYKPNNFVDQYKNFKKHWSKYGLKSTDFIVVFLGNFGIQFVLEPVIDAAKKLQHYKDIKFVLCGVGESFNRISHLSRNLESVILPGWIEEEQIFSLLSVASVGIAPYRNSINFTNNIPNKFGEYLSASLPVILGIEGLMAELISQYECGAVYKNSEELALILKELYLNEERLKLMSNNAYHLYNLKFNADKVYLELAKHLEQIHKNYQRMI